MMKNLKAIAGTAIILATIATTTVQAKQTEADAPKTQRVVQQKLAKAQASYFFLVLGVGF